MTLSQFGKLSLLLLRYPIAIQSLVNRIQQVLIQEGLSKEFHRAGLHGLHRHRNISVTSDEDDGNPDAGFSQLPLKIQTANLREFDVQDKTTWSVWTLTAQELLCCLEGLGLQALRLEQAFNGRTNQIVVINDEYRGITWNRH
jgi:hypothetical protein